MIEVFIGEAVQVRGDLVPGQQLLVHQGGETWLFQRIGERVLLVKKEKPDVKDR